MIPWEEDFEAMVRELVDIPASVPILADDKLIELGMDSMQMMFLFSDLEEHYDIQFPEDAGIEMFDSAGTLWKAVTAAREKRATGQ